MEKTFRDMLQEIVNMDEEDKLKCGLGAYGDLAPALARFDTETNGLALAITIMGTAAAADGTLTTEEIAFLMALSKSEGMELTVEEAAGLVKKTASKDKYQLIQHLAQALEPNEHAALVLFVATLCALDDRISAEEIAYIESLL